MKFVLKGASVATVFVILGCGSAADPTAHRVLVPEPRSLDIGEVWEQSNFPWQVVVENPGPRSVVVKELNTACSCVAVQPRSLVVQPGATAAVDLILDLRDRGVRFSSDNVTRPFSTFSTVLTPTYADGETRPADVWHVTGTIRHPFVGIPRVWNLGVISEGTLKRQTATLAVGCASGISLVAAQCDEDWATTGLSVDPTGKPSVNIQLTRGDVGRFQFPLQLHARTSEGTRLPPVEISVIGDIAGDIEIYPPAAALGLLHAGQSIENTVYLRSRSGQPLKINNVVCVDRHVNVVPYQNVRPDDGSALAYTVRLNSDQAPGSYSTTVNFDVDASGQPPVTVSFRMTYAVCENIN